MKALNRPSLLLALLFVGVVPVTAIAQEEGGSGAVASDEAPAAPVEDAWTSAMQALTLGDFGGAQALLASFASGYPDDPRAAWATTLQQSLAAALSRPDNEIAVTSQVGRVENVIFSTIWGLGTGVLVGLELADAIGSEDEGKVPLWTSIAMGGTALGVSLFVTQGNPPTEGQSAMFSSAGFWGYAIGGELVAGTALGNRCRDDEWGTYCELEPHPSRLVPVGLSSAALVGAALYARSHPEVATGDVAVVNAGGAWGSVTAAALALAVDSDSDRAPFDYLLVGTSLGVSTAVGLTRPVHVSRSRMGLINLAGALGIGLTTAIGATAEVDDPQAWGSLILAGEAVGLTTGALLTRQHRNHRRGADD